MTEACLDGACSRVARVMISVSVNPVHIVSRAGRPLSASANLPAGSPTIPGSIPVITTG